MAAPTTKQTRQSEQASPAKEPPASVRQFDPEGEAPPPLTPALLASYNASHYRLLLWLSLLLAFIISIFPISDPDIFYSLQVGKMISAGEFPWGSDPFCYAQGDQAPWVHNGWLGDLLIYDLYQLGGGPLLVFFRAILVVLLFWMLSRLGTERAPRFWTVLTIFLGIVAIGQRLYFRTELFSLVLLGVVFWLVAQRPRQNCWLSFLHRYTAGRWYWLLPVVFLFWANLDGWFFLGLAVVAIWTLGCWMKPDGMSKKELQSLGLCTLLSFAACLATPFHVKSFLQIPARLWPPTAGELQGRYLQQKKENSKQRMSEQQRGFEMPFGGEFFQLQRSDVLASLGNQAPFLALVYPSGLSISEWAYYPLLVVVLASCLFGSTGLRWRTIPLLTFFVILGVWQSRFVGFFVVGTVAVAVLQFQSLPVALPYLNRSLIILRQLFCLLLGLLIQCLCLLHLMPTPDLSPSTLGYLHPRGAFGISFRSDPLIEQACKKMGQWQTSKQVVGHPFHYDWTDVAAYDSWFNPSGKHFFDRRHDVHDLATTKDFLAASDALLATVTDPIKESSQIDKMFERQDKWQDVFKRHQISHLIVKKRGQQQSELVRSLLVERDRQNRPVWQPLQLHNGQVYALAWVGSPYWKELEALAFDSEKAVFRQDRLIAQSRPAPAELGSFTRFLYGDATRRPAALDEASWHLYYAQTNPVGMAADQLANLETVGLVSRITARLANPLSTSPIIPMWLSQRQGSASALFLSLDAVRRAAAELTAESPAYQQAEVYLQYLQTVTLMMEYEKNFAPVAARYHEQQRLFLLHRAAVACYEAMHPSTFFSNMELARAYRNAGALDAAWEHCVMARTFIERQRSEETAPLLKNLDNICKQQFGFAPTELQNQVKQQTEYWTAHVQQMGWMPTQSEPGKDIANRAGLAVQAGLPKRALEELMASGVKTTEVAFLAFTIYGVLGQHDLAWVEFLSRMPDLRAKLGEINYQLSASLGEWCLGRPEQAALYRLEAGKLMNIASLEAGLNASLIGMFGTSSQVTGNVLASTMEEQQAASATNTICDQQVTAGLLYLEAGKPQRAAELFAQAVRQTDPNTPWRPLLERYYLQITGNVLAK